MHLVVVALQSAEIAKWLLFESGEDFLIKKRSKESEKQSQEESRGCKCSGNSQRPTSASGTSPLAGNMATGHWILAASSVKIVG